MSKSLSIAVVNLNRLDSSFILRQGTAGRNQIFGQNIDFRFLTVYDAIIPNLHVHVAINSLCVLYYINKDI